MRFIKLATSIAIALAVTTGCRNEPGFTVAEFQKLEPGLSFQQVQRIVGSAPDHVSEIEEIKAKICTWQDEGAWSSVTFENDQLKTCSRFDLKTKKMTPHPLDPR